MTAVCDVIMPVYNGEATVEMAVQSLLCQTLTDLRVIIVDDGSAPSCANILERLESIDPRVLLLRQKNAGIVTALNYGLSASTAPYVARLDADDVSTPDRIARQIKYFESNPDVVATSGCVRHINSAGDVIGAYIPRDPSEADPTWAPSVEPYLLHPFLAVRRQAIFEIGGYRHVHHSEDTDLYWRLREKGKLVNLPDTLGDYRLHTESISGASTLNGRIMAIHSQLAAVSARRRGLGDRDLVFPQHTLGEYKIATELQEMVKLANGQLTVDESVWFNVAVAGKMLELASYRPWALEYKDIEFIREHCSFAKSSISPENFEQLTKLVKGAGAMLILQSRLRAAIKLCPFTMYGDVIARVGKKIALGTR